MGIRFSRIVMADLLEKGLKRCPVCKHILKLENFGISKHTKSGYNYACKKCAVEKQKQFAIRHPGYHKRYAEKYRKDKKGVK